MAVKKSKHAFGSEANVDTALSSGLIDAFDVLFLDEGKIGWVDKNGNKVILEDKKQVMTVTGLPSTGTSDIIYIYNSKMYIWDGTQFVSPHIDGTVSENTVDQKVSAATDESKAYTDSQIEAATGIIEF